MDKPKRIVFSMNPDTHNKLMFICSKDHDNRSIQGELEYLVIHRYNAVKMNSYLALHDPEYLKQLRTIPEAQRRAYVEGTWDILEDKFCDGCIHLSPDELEQNCIPGKPDHRCVMYGERVHHNGWHPHIVRLDECTSKETAQPK
jgi:hypothetical protein